MLKQHHESILNLQGKKSTQKCVSTPYVTLHAAEGQTAQKIKKYSSQTFAMYMHTASKELENFKKENRKRCPVVSDSFATTSLDKQIILQE